MTRHFLKIDFSLTQLHVLRSVVEDRKVVLLTPSSYRRCVGQQLRVHAFLAFLLPSRLGILYLCESSYFRQGVI